jgi:hypothetical protein
VLEVIASAGERPIVRGAGSTVASGVVDQRSLVPGHTAAPDQMLYAGVKCLKLSSTQTSANTTPSIAYLLADTPSRIVGASLYIPATAHVPEAIQAMISALDELSQLNDGWDSYDAPKPNLAARESARHVLEILNGHNRLPTAVVPSAEGGVGFAFSGKANRYADIECLNSGEMLAVISDRVSEPEVWTIGIESTLADTIERISTFLDA